MIIYFVVRKSIFEPLFDLIYPKSCLVCHKALPDRNNINPICLVCWDKIEWNLPPFCNICGRHVMDNEETCKTCQKRNYGFMRNFSVTNYSTMMRSLIHLFKYKNKTSLAKPFAKAMSDFFTTYNLSRFKFNYLTAIPLAPARLREREYNQSQLLCKEISGILGIKSSVNNLKRIKHTEFQSSLNENERLNNVTGAFALNDPKEFAQKNILLIDDLLTTGATVSEAASALKQAGANQIFTLTLAITP